MCRLYCSCTVAKFSLKHIVWSLHLPISGFLLLYFSHVYIKKTTNKQANPFIIFLKPSDTENNWNSQLQSFILKRNSFFFSCSSSFCGLPPQSVHRLCHFQLWCSVLPTDYINSLRTSGSGIVSLIPVSHSFENAECLLSS